MLQLIKHKSTHCDVEALLQTNSMLSQINGSLKTRYSDLYYFRLLMSYSEVPGRSEMDIESLVSEDGKSNIVAIAQPSRNFLISSVRFSCSR